MNMVQEEGETENQSSPEEGKKELTRNVLARLFGRSSVPSLPILKGDPSSTFVSKKNDAVIAGKTLENPIGNGKGMMRRRSSFMALPNTTAMSDIREMNLIPEGPTCSTTRQTHDGRKGRMRADSETMTIAEEEEVMRAFVKSRRSVRRKTSVSRSSRTSDGQGDGAELPPMVRSMLTRRKSTRPSIGLDDSVSSSGWTAIRKGSVAGRMSEWRRLSLLIKQQEELGEQKRKEEARIKFVHAAKMVIILHRIYRAIFKTTKETVRMEPVTFTSLAEQYESDNMKMSGLSFDRNYFKAKKEESITQDVRNILCSPSYARTKEQLATALIGLQTMKSFAEYPLHMQEKLVKVAWYEFIPPKRVIIRQGHYAENFYFVISGSVVVTILTTNPNTSESVVRTAAILRRGSSFGEIAILHHGRRTATVSSQGPVHLLAITREDFFDIFMRGQEPGQEPEHVSFLRQISCFKYWPIEQLVEHPEMCLFHFYKRGHVIVKDSNNSDWIYVVKSGACQVIMQLKAVKPHRHAIKDKAENGKQMALLTPRTHTGYDTSSRRRSNKKSSLPSIEQLKLSAPRKHILEMAANRRMSIQHMDLQSLTSDTPIFLTRSKTISEISEDEDDTESMSSHMTNHMTNHLRYNHQHVTNFLPDIDMRKGAVPIQQSFSPSAFHSFRSTARSSKKGSGRREKMSKSVSPPMIRFSEAPEHGRGRRASLPADRKGVSVFIQVELLHPKEVFGLSSLDLDLGIDHTQSSVSLVSRGAECVMIKKDFFAKHASQAVKRNIRSFVYAYPPEEKLQQNLQSHSNWSHYKEETISGVLGEKSKTKDVKT